MTADEEYNLFIEKSKRYFEDAIINYGKEYYDLSMFSLRQSLELFLKALLIKNEDKNSEIYLFGSVLGGNYNMSSDIDILIVTDEKEKIMKLLWDNDYDEPFEFHIKYQNEAKKYFEHIKKIKRIL